eukprot:359441-Chlamydomonas_euryale.AAC.6
MQVIGVHIFLCVASRRIGMSIMCAEHTIKNKKEIGNKYCMQHLSNHLQQVPLKEGITVRKAAMRRCTWWHGAAARDLHSWCSDTVRNWVMLFWTVNITKPDNIVCMNAGIGQAGVGAKRD